MTSDVLHQANAIAEYRAAILGGKICWIVNPARDQRWRNVPRRGFQAQQHHVTSKAIRKRLLEGEGFR